MRAEHVMLAHWVGRRTPKCTGRICLRCRACERRRCRKLERLHDTKNSQRMENAPWEWWFWPRQGRVWDAGEDCLEKGARCSLLPARMIPLGMCAGNVGARIAGNYCLSIGRPLLPAGKTRRPAQFGIRIDSRA